MRYDFPLAFLQFLCKYDQRQPSSTTTARVPFSEVRSGEAVCDCWFANKNDCLGTRSKNSSRPTSYLVPGRHILPNPTFAPPSCHDSPRTHHEPLPRPHGNVPAKYKSRHRQLFFFFSLSFLDTTACSRHPSVDTSSLSVFALKSSYSVQKSSLQNPNHVWLR